MRHARVCISQAAARDKSALDPSTLDLCNIVQQVSAQLNALRIAEHGACPCPGPGRVVKR